MEEPVSIIITHEQLRQQHSILLNTSTDNWCYGKS